MFLSHLGLLVGSFILWNGLLAAPHTQIPASPPGRGALAQDGALSEEPRFITSETPEPEKKSLSIDVAVKPMSSSGQAGNAGSGEKQGNGEMASFKVESAETMDPAPAKNISASPLLGGKPTKIPKYLIIIDDDEDDDDDEAEEHEAEKADDDYDAAENAEEADDDDDDGDDREGL